VTDKDSDADVREPARAHFVLDRDLPLIERLADSLGRPLEAAIVERLGRYLELVSRWNRTVNLTAARRAAEQAEVLLSDAMVMADPAFLPVGARLVDVGSGSGSPALPLILMRGDLSGVLVEPRRKRVAFLRSAVGTLRLMESVQVREERIDPENPRVAGQPFDVAISRAAFAPERWLSIGARLAARVLVLTAGAGDPEVPVGFSRARSVDYALPGSGAPRRATLYLSSSSDP
jgi:16S rRNA (guanine527-N7)-methyltransferase